MRESELYRPVAKYFKSQHGCLHKATWIAGSGKDLAFPAGFGKRKPDVVACKAHPIKPEIHLAEGKLLNLPTHGFEETINQLESFRPYADYLWAVFPAEQWTSAVNNHERWLSQLRQRGYGMLLVNGSRVKKELEALSNSNVDKECKKSILEEMLGDSDEPLVLSTLSTNTAKSAMRAAARVAEIMSGTIRDILGKNCKESTCTAPCYPNSAAPFFTLGCIDFSKGYIQGDPFSTYLNDGRALIWVWRSYGNLCENEKIIRTAVAKPHPIDTYFHADNDNWQWICRPLSELSLESIKASGYLAEFSLGRAIPISDRTLKGIAADLRRLIAWTKDS